MSNYFDHLFNIIFAIFSDLVSIRRLLAGFTQYTPCFVNVFPQLSLFGLFFAFIRRSSVTKTHHPDANFQRLGSFVAGRARNPAAT